MRLGVKNVIRRHSLSESVEYRLVLPCIVLKIPALLVRVLEGFRSPKHQFTLNCGGK